MTIFQQALKAHVRFPSIKGDLTTEQLFDLPLTSRQGLDLDTVARAVNTELKAAGEESFVGSASNPARTVLALKLDVVKAIIADREAENASKAGAAARKEEIQTLMEIKAGKQQEALKAMTAEQIDARIAELSK